LFVLLAAPAAAQETVGTERFLDLQTIPLWPGAAPGAKGDAPADVPSFSRFAPWQSHRNGTAVIIAPGGSYAAVASTLEGREVADWFAARGVTAFVLNYRLGDRYPFPQALIDAQRAIRLVRANAVRWGLDPHRIGMVGFSAGGHLAAMAGVDFDGGAASAADPVERADDRPDFLVLGYPAIGFMAVDAKGSSLYCASRRQPAACAASSFERYQPDRLVRIDTPPAFIVHANDDPLSPDNSVRFYDALRAKGVSAELHVFAAGGHGFGLGSGDAALDLWPLLLEAWLRERGMLTPSAAPAFDIDDSGPLSLDSSLSRLAHEPRARALIEKTMGRPLGAGWDKARQISARTLLDFDLTIRDADLRALDAALRALPH
jgi:acetyl esterase/lipase